jgi:tetratricopeptide (TPR) repeat protein
MRRLAALLAILAALLVQPARAGQDDPRLDELFARLKAPLSGREAATVQSQIWSIWIEGDNEDVNLTMRQGVQAMARQDFDAALSAFDRVVELAPGFAEGWNKRATVRFLMEDYPGSVLDIERTLLLEPRHWGALSGLGQINLALDRKEAALKAFEAAIAINPHLDSVRAAVESLKKEIGGRPT